ncbi:hypothetical protein VARIO8X_60392 [Burkholderiales bacterium 8X]|nr:hypothetical protein VARIO8X_60392 [Burkholderiales bacterium 8X]
MSTGSRTDPCERSARLSGRGATAATTCAVLAGANFTRKFSTSERTRNLDASESRLDPQDPCEGRPDAPQATEARRQRKRQAGALA